MKAREKGSGFHTVAEAAWGLGFPSPPGGCGAIIGVMASPARTRALAHLHRVFSEVSRAVDLCLEQNLQVPALILLYSGMDIAGSMATYGQNKSVQDSFTGWVDDYIRPTKTLGCTSLELFGARCGIVHTFTPESTLYQQGKARKVIYAWSPSRVETLRETTDLGRMSRQYVPIQGDDLVKTYKQGINRFLGDLNQLPTGGLVAVANRVFGLMSTEESKAMLAWGKRLLGKGP